MIVILGKSGTVDAQKVESTKTWFPLSGQEDLDVVRDLLEECRNGQERSEGLALSIIHAVLETVAEQRPRAEVLAEAHRLLAFLREKCTLAVVVWDVPAVSAPRVGQPPMVVRVEAIEAD